MIQFANWLNGSQTESNSQQWLSGVRVTETLIESWEDGSEVKSTDYSSRGPGFNSSTNMAAQTVCDSGSRGSNMLTQTHMKAKTPINIK